MEMRPDRDSGEMLLSGFLKGYIESRTDIRDRTRNNLWQAANFLTEFFGSDRRLDSITPGDGDQWRVWLLEGSARIPHVDIVDGPNSSSERLFVAN